jgi:hypothetical protein
MQVGLAECEKLRELTATEYSRGCSDEHASLLEIIDKKEKELAVAMPDSDIETSEEYIATLSEIEELWLAPMGELDAARIIMLRRRVLVYEAKTK